MIAPQDVWIGPELLDGREGVRVGSSDGCGVGWGAGVGVGCGIIGVTTAGV